MPDAKLDKLVTKAQKRLHFGASISIRKYFSDQAARNDFVDKVGDYLRDVWGLNAEDFWIRTENSDA